MRRNHKKSPVNRPSVPIKIQKVERKDPQFNTRTVRTELHFEPTPGISFLGEVGGGGEEGEGRRKHFDAATSIAQLHFRD